MNYQEAYQKLKEADQLHVLKYYEELTAEQKEMLLAQIEATDFTVIDACKKENLAVEKGVITPLGAMELDEIKANKDKFTEIGVKIKEAEGFELVMPCALTNGYEGYFPVQSAYDEGGYEARSSRYAAGIAETIVEAGKAIVAELAK